ncbi:hypothetical protein JAO71_00660 [Olleya sp. YSTF-M6]|uniref:Uncharacterized protein n=1 Tax=Olleya sediminilitoris TaxID=2795739 RepID=A0ABS1WGP1_9FLAO|nr:MULTISPECIES: hypothetical protein [Olleya]MBL7558296.1 hypothetical protein [Olleya sediminilitoris]
MTNFKPILLLTFLAITLTSCVDGASKAHSAMQEEDIPDCKIMIILGDDRSGSSQSIQKLDKTDYEAVIDIINQNGHGYFASTIIGNPAPNSKEIFRLKVSALKPYEDILTSENPTLTEQAKQKKHNEKIKAKNEKIKKKNQSRLKSFLSKTLESSILGYKPHKGNDITNIDLAFGHINKLLKEPNIEDYDKVIVALFTDGVNEPVRSGKIVDIKNNLELTDNAELYLVGWKDTSVFGGIEINEFEGKEGFFSYLEDFECL